MKRRLEAFRVIGYYTGRIQAGLGLLMVAPLTVALLYREWPTAIDFLIGIAVAELVGYGLVLLCWDAERHLTWVHGMVAASTSWLVGTLLCALPYYLSGHWASYLDAAFDVMSGFTTTGLFLAQDLDHISMGVNMWRHLLTYVGGQGMVVMALTIGLALFVVIDGIRRLVRCGPDERPWLLFYVCVQVLYLLALVVAQLHVLPGLFAAIVAVVTPLSLILSFVYLLRIVYPKHPESTPACELGIDAPDVPPPSAPPAA
jgi:hypothetical protein